MDEEIKEVVEEVAEIKPKQRQKKFTVKLVTQSSIIYEDNGVSKFISKKGFENLKAGDTFKI